LREHSQPGERIALFFPQGLEFIATFLACLMAGRIAVPVNLPTRRRVERCLTILDDSGSRLLLVADSERAALQQAFAGSAAADLAMLSPTSACDDDVQWSRPDDSDPQRIAFLQYTSGSTSAPKGVMVSHANISANLRMMRDSWALDHTSDFVTWQPHHHDLGLILGQLLPIVLGNHTVLMAPSTFVRQPLICCRRSPATRLDWQAARTSPTTSQRNATTPSAWKVWTCRTGATLSTAPTWSARPACNASPSATAPTVFPPMPSCPAMGSPRRPCS
jgi:acyl-coenzyme A synthetase/AMP-(fatty) acid ligase